MDNLIFDRKNQDVTKLKTLRTKVRNRTASTEEYEEWLTSLKGAYNNTDLNRVGEAINFLSELLNNYGYTNDAKARTDWAIEEKPNPEQMQDYLNNLNKLKEAYYIYSETVDLPNDMVGLTFDEANNIEKMLYDINEIIENMEKNFVFSGVANCGQNRLWQQRFRRLKYRNVKRIFRNIIPDNSFENELWNGAVYSTAEKKFGNKSLYFPTGTTYVPNIEIERPIVGHKYYGRRYIKSNGDNQPADSRFEVWGADGANMNWVYAWNNGNHPEWEFNSAIHEIVAVGYPETDRTIIRCFNVSTTADTWVDGLMLIDLTETFGEGKEPTLEWCDENIPYIKGTEEITVKEEIKE